MISIGSKKFILCRRMMWFKRNLRSHRLSLNFIGRILSFRSSKPTRWIIFLTKSSTITSLDGSIFPGTTPISLKTWSSIILSSNRIWESPSEKYLMWLVLSMLARQGSNSSQGSYGTGFILAIRVILLCSSHITSISWDWGLSSRTKMLRSP